MNTIVLRAQIIYEIKSFTAMLQRGVPFTELQQAREKIRQLMNQLDLLEETPKKLNPEKNN